MHDQSDTAGRWKTELSVRLTTLHLTPQREAAIVEELSQHLDDRWRDLIAAGTSDEDAARAIERELSLEGLKAYLAQRGLVERLMPARETGSPLRLFAAFPDIRQSLRALWRARLFACQVALTLGIGIGTTTAVLSLIHGVLLTPPPYEDPERLVLISPRATEGAPLPADGGWPSWQWQEWQDVAESFEHIAAYRWGSDFLFLNDGSQSVEGMSVTAQYFGVTGLQAQLGRTFVESDAAGAETLAVILGHDVWQQRFAGDPDIVGKTVRLSLEFPRTVVGVMPPDIRFLPSPGAISGPNYNVDARVDYWISVPQFPGRDPRAPPIWNVVAKLRDGVTVAEAEAELAVITARQTAGDPALTNVAAEINALSTVLNVDGRRILLPLLAAAALVLLISCANAAAGLLVRGFQRQHEYGVRSALGAKRVILFKHVIMESVLLALCGSAVGTALAFAIVQVFKVLAANAIPRLDAVSAGWPVLVLSGGTALVACVLASFYPAARASAVDPVDALRAGGTKSTAGIPQRRLMGGVLVAQMALTFALLVGAGLLMRTMYNVAAVQPGYDTSNVVTIDVTSGDGQWTTYDGFHGRVLERVSALPGVEDAAFAWGLPLTDNSWPTSAEIEGYAPADGSVSRVALRARGVTPGYFGLMRQTIQEGRDFRSTDKWSTAADRNVTPMVAVVNQEFVDRYLSGIDPLGKRLSMQMRPPAEIIGVVSNSRTEDLTRPVVPEVYLSLWQAQVFTGQLVVRASSNPQAIMAAVQREIRAVAPNAAMENPKTLEQVRAESLAARMFAADLFGGFAVVASILTLGGIYNVLSLSMASRRRELAIRFAVGASRSSIVNLVLRDGCRLIALGIIGGAAVALSLSGVLQTLLYEVRPADPLTLTAAALTLAVVALAACLIPARRASLVGPSEALRSE